jgi:NADH-quinone oxidoreductase subunit L
LVSAGLLLVFGKATNKWGHWLGVLASSASLVIGLIALFTLLGRTGSQRVVDAPLYTMWTAGDLSLSAGFRIDPLSLTFVGLVTFVGTLIHIYSVAYMRHDGDRRRFFAYLNLFVAAMLLLVLADSYILLFFGWEGVGLASYLLIGFWNDKPVNAVAAKKAFIANRIGDVGMIIAMMIMFGAFGTLSFAGVFNKIGSSGPGQGTLTAIGLMLLLAACGKSAQFPLQSWLGDAMAGPTPVSALIHAATMVTAGVYLVVRSGPIFAGTPDARLVVVIVGAVTLLFGAIVGSAKDDMKKVLAASTMSQIGYMMLAAGLGPIGAAFAIMHLVTHGFFKADLFLGAGSVMHAMSDQVDMRRFGGLRSIMKVTWITFMMGWLAILGIPPFSGFWSKDKIISAAFSQSVAWQSWVFGLVALVGAGITAFYMSRLFFMMFHGHSRWTEDAHPHESSPLMTVPMAILALGAVGLGWTLSIIGFTGWLSPVTGDIGDAKPVLPEAAIMTVTLVLVLFGAVYAWYKYGKSAVPEIAPRGTVWTRLARRDLGQDDVNDVLLVKPGQQLTGALALTDTHVVDGGVRGVAALVAGFGQATRKLQNGYVRSYAATMVAGVIIVVAIVLAVRM